MGSIKEFETCIFEKRDDGIAIVTLNRPEKLNAINRQMTKDINPCWDEINENPEIRVAILTASGRAFCSGRDILEHVAEYAEEAAAGSTPTAGMVRGIGFHHYEVRKPLIGAINGLALAGGLDLFLLPDIRVMAEGAYVGTWAQRVNLAPEPWIHYFLPWAIAQELQLTAGTMDAEECLRWGLVNKVVPIADLMPTALDYAKKICEIYEMGPDAILKTRAGYLQHLRRAKVVWKTEEEMRGAAEWSALTTPERRVEGMKAWAENRKANYEDLAGRFESAP